MEKYNFVRCKQGDSKEIPLCTFHPRHDTFFREDLVMKIVLRSFKKSSCQITANGFSLGTGKLMLRGFPRNSVVRITDHPDMT